MNCSLFLSGRAVQYDSNRLDDYSSLFEISKYELSNIFNTSLNYDILLFKSFRYTEQTLVATQAAPTRSLQALFKINCWGPIDGTVRHAHIQRMVYIGDKRVHDLKFQSIMATNEIFTFFFSLSTAILQNV